MWNGLAFFIYMPWLARASSILSGYGGNGDSPPLADALVRALSVFAVGETVAAEQRLAWALLGGALLLLGAVRLWAGGANNRRTLWLLLCWLAVPLALTWYSAQSRPIFNERYLVAAAPAFYLLAGAAFERRPRIRWLDWLAAGLLIALLAGMALSLWRYQVEPAYSKSRGWREVAMRAEQLAGGMDDARVRFAQNYPDPTLWYYLHADSHLTLPPAAGNADRAAAEVAALGEDGIERVVLIQQNSPRWDDYTQGEGVDGIAAIALQEHFSQTVSVDQGNFRIAVFDAPSAPFAESDIAFDDIYRIKGVAIAPDALAAGGVLSVALAWESLPILPDAPHKVTLQLLGPDGSVLAQQDAPLAVATPAPTGEATTTRYGILLPETLPAGDYRLIAAIYDPNAEGLPRLPVGGADYAILTEWSIE
jgi:hypothetical protein